MGKEPKTYIGFIAVDGHQQVKVHPSGDPLPLRLDVASHSPMGFGWGYGGAGPAQLALAILCDLPLPPDEALSLHQLFKWQVIANIPGNQGWTMSEEEVREWLASPEGKIQ
jgi:hypothetical protein